MQELISEIEEIDLSKRSIKIKAPSSEHNAPFYAEERYMKGIDFNSLSVGDKVSFTPYKLVAQNIKLIIDRKQSKLISTILEKTEEHILIKKLDNEQPKDFYAQRKYIKNIDFESLTVGTEVKFKPYINGDNYIAQELESVSINNSNNEDVFTITRNFISSLRNKVNNVKHGHTFEHDTLVILRLLGIPNIYPIPQDYAEGKCDGIFKIDSLEVVYDCTLRSESEWKERKKTQIYTNYVTLITQTQTTENYILDGKNISKTITFGQKTDKQIWVITKGNTKVINDIDGKVVIKEVSIYDLIDLAEERLIEY